MLQIHHQASGQQLQIDAFWLRDHCRCAKCYNVSTKQRRYNLLDIPPTVAPITQTYTDSGKTYVVEWSDGHSSSYDIEFLHAAQVEQVIARAQYSTGRTPWTRSIVLQSERHLRIAMPALVGSETKVKELVSALIRYGIAFIDEVPPNAVMTEMAVRRIFPVMKTFFGDLWTFTDTETSHADTAYTKEFLGSHTDNTYFTDAAGLQALHCIKHVNGTGGENFFVDGLHAALELKRRNPRAFHVLATVQVPAEYIEEGEHHTHAAPLIRTDPITGDIVQLRLNVYDRAVFDRIPQTEMAEFYACLREYLQIVQSAENQWRLKLQPGTLVIFDNWRVFHGRYAYTGQRTMTGCYVQRTDFLSKARILGLID